ncbi:MAG: hypothetical protein P0116_01730 [Candidatus Nitrosocosmicus sp.]|nr:hypothetical protein [Candidatus Nitrosocosmicus sp.]
MTPDLPGNLAEEVSQDPVNQDLLSSNETQQISPNATVDSQLVVLKMRPLLHLTLKSPLKMRTDDNSR